MADPNSYGFGYDPFGAGIPQLLPKWDSGQNMLTQPGVGLPIGWGTAAGMAGGIAGTAIGNPLVNAAMNLPQQMSDLGHGIPLTANSAGTGIDPYIGNVVDVSGMLMGAGMPMAEAGAAGIFGGKLAQTMNRNTMEMAQDMLSRGVPKEKVWRDTGWMQGTDKQWRFEIPDQNATLQGKGSIGSTLTNMQGDTVGDALHHPELFRAYPELKDMPLSGVAPSGSGGRYIRGDILDPDSRPSIQISNLYNGNEAKSVLLHELQHAVQDIEGFATGGSPSYFTYQNDPLFALRKSYESPYDAYKRIAGEVEARNVQSRIPVSDLGRRLIYPNPDVLPENQIVLMRKP